ERRRSRWCGGAACAPCNRRAGMKVHWGRPWRYFSVLWRLRLSVRLDVGGNSGGTHAQADGDGPGGMLLAAVETLDPVIAVAVAHHPGHRITDLRRQTHRAGDVLAQHLLPRFPAHEDQTLRGAVLDRRLVISAAQFQIF